MITADTKLIIKELTAVLEASDDIDKVSTGPLEPIVTEESSAAVYIAVESVTLENSRLTTGANGYDRHMLINLYCNVDTSEDPLGIYDFMDGLERTILDDSELWTVLVDRDVVGLNFDAQQFEPKRTVTMLIDISYRLTCN